MDSGHFLDAAATLWRVPRVDAARCVHSHIETASCERCLNACPRGAWVMDDDMLGIDTEACDGCALCAPACPEGAVFADHQLEIRRAADGQEYGFAACEHGSTADAPGRMPCVHAIGVAALLQFYRRGVRHVFVARGRCSDCVRGTAETIEARVASLNGLLGDRGLPPMRIVPLGADRWEALRETGDDASHPAISRRGFLREAIGRAVDRVAPPGLPAVAAAEIFTPPGRLLPHTRENQRVFFAPGIDPLRCNGCDACLRLCPHGALGMAETGDAYTIDADACTGCRVCVDVCDRGAICVNHWAESRGTTVALAQGSCAGCGVAFHRPAAQGQCGAWCRICEAKGNHQKLFQVMD